MSLLARLKKYSTLHASNKAENQKFDRREHYMDAQVDSGQITDPVTPSLPDTLQCLEKDIERCPENVEANLKLMNVHESLGDTETARRILLKLDTLSSGNRSLQTQVARQFMKAGDNELAIERWCEIEARYKDQYEATNALAHLYLRTNRFTQVLEAADRLESEFQMVERANRIRIKCFMEQGRWAEAISTLELVLHSDSDDLDAHIQMVNCFLKLNDHESASRKVALLFEEYPDNNRVKALKHRIYLREENWVKAIEMDISSGNRSLQTQVAKQLMNAGDNERAIVRWCEMENQYKDQYEATNSLAHLYLRTNRFTQVLEAADRLETQFQQVERANRLRIRCFMEQGRWLEAISTLELVLHSDSDDLDAHIQMVNCFLKLNDHESASRKVALLYEGYPDNNRVKALKHRIYLREENWEKAIEMNTLLLSDDPNNTNILSDRAMIMYRLGQYKDSENHCLEVLDNRPDDIRMLTIYARLGQARANRLNTSGFVKSTNP